MAVCRKVGTNEPTPKPMTNKMHPASSPHIKLPCEPALQSMFASRKAGLFTRVASAAFLGALVASSYGATILVNDTWKDATRTDPASPTYCEVGADTDVDGDIESLWYRSGTGSSTTMQTNHMIHTAAAASSMSLTTYFSTNNGAVSLNNLGDKLTITWVFKPNGITATGAGNQDMRIAIVDTGTRLTGDATPANAVYSGYGIFMNMRAGTLGNASPLRIMEWAVSGGANNLLSTAGAWLQDATATATVGTTGGYSEGNTYTLVWSATRTSSGADIYQKITDSGTTLGSNGVLEVSYSDSSPQTLTFDTFSLRPSTPETTATNFDTTLFKVEFTPGGCVPTSHNVTGTTTVCPGGTSTVGLSGSDVNVDYHLLLGGSPTGTSVAGTGSAISFGLQSVGTYTVYASNTTITCEGLMNGSAVISQYASPNVTVNPSPADATNAIGGTRIFTVTATGSALAYQWRKDSVNLVNGGNISGATTNALTISGLTTNDAGSYDCLVSNTICGIGVASAPAVLTIVGQRTDMFRSVTSGDWATTSTWEQSTNGGAGWFAATDVPSYLVSNIVIQTGHTVTSSADITVDDLTVQSGATLQGVGGSLILNNGVGVYDVDVFGTLEIAAGPGVANTAGATLRFNNGSSYKWSFGAAPAVPTAVWEDGSTCLIGATAASTATATGITGQSFYDFVYDTTASGQSARCRLDIQGTSTAVRRDFSVSLPDTHNASVTINNSASGLLTVGRHVNFTTGSSTNSNKVLLNNAAGNSYTLKVGGNFNATGFVDGFGGSSSVIEFNGTSAQYLNMPLTNNLLTSSAVNYLVDSNSTVILNGLINAFATLTNMGTLNLSNYSIIGGTTVVLDPNSQIIGSGTNKMLSAISSLVGGGTIRLGALPAFTGGETFQLFGSAAYSGTFGSIIPATPGAGLTWDTTSLNTAGVLAVQVGSGTATNPTNIVATVGGGNLTLTWPASHIGWTLQTQTNSRSVGLIPATNAWFNVSGSTTTNQVVIPVSPSEPTVFYRLKL